MKPLARFAHVVKVCDGSESKFLVLLFLPILLFIIVWSGPAEAPAATLEVCGENRTVAACVPQVTPPDQTKAEECRKIQKELDQYDKAFDEVVRTLDIKEKEDQVRTTLSELRRAIAGGYVM